MGRRNENRPDSRKLAGEGNRGGEDGGFSKSHGENSPNYRNRQERLESALAWMERLYDALNDAGFVIVSDNGTTAAIMEFMRAWERLADACLMDDRNEVAIFECLKDATKHATVIHQHTGDVQIVRIGGASCPH